MKFSYVTIYVKDIKAVAGFYEKAFGLKTRFVHESGLYAEMETGATMLAFAQAELAKTLVPGGYTEASLSQKPANVQIAFEPENVKLALERALVSGAVLAAPYEVKPWGWESVSVRDIEGNLVELARECRDNPAAIGGC